MLQIGSLIDGKYKILAKIGQGGMSVVYLAMNEKANKQWAIKELRKDGVKNFEVVKQGLIVETEMLKRLNHPNLPSIIDVIEKQDTFLIVMDYIEGNTLEKSLEEFGAQPQEYVIKWAKQLCDVLGYLHTRKPPIIYRDMKPSNIMLKPDGHLTLIDFGTAREFKEKNLADTTCLGTIGYAAPEQFGGKGQTDVRTDIYCLGATLYHLITGCNPCEPPYDMKPIREINPSLSSGLEKIIKKCTQKNPQQRYQNCAELMYDLEHYNEIDDIYMRKQRKKLITFSISCLLTFICVGMTVFSSLGAKNKKNQNYDAIIARASNEQLKQNERIDLYIEAMKIDQSNTKAYLELISMLVQSDNILAKEEVAAIIQLKAGVDEKKSNGYSNTIYLLDTLKKSNLMGYYDVCYEIALAYWYDYEVESNRYLSAIEWFKESVDRYPIAQTYIDLGQCQQEIKRFSSQNRTEKVHESYKKLWEKIKELKNNEVHIQEMDTKLLIWREIVEGISSQAEYFIVNIEEKELYSLLNNIENDVRRLEEGTKYKDVKVTTKELLEKINVAKLRIESAKKSL